MAYFISKGTSIAGIATAVPKRRVLVDDYINTFGTDVVEKFKQKTGIISMYRTEEHQTASDLGYAASEHLLDELDIDRSKVGLLIFIKKSIKKADLVFVQTEWMKRAIIRECRISKNVIHIIPPEVKNDNKYQYKLERNQFFYPAAFENTYKNQNCIYEASDILRNKGYTNYEIVLTLDKYHQKKSGCKFIGLLDRGHLFKYYSTSVLLFPSYVETVGLPAYT